MKNKNIKLKGLTMIGISAIPLLIYPFVLIANVMSLTGHRGSDTSFVDVFIAYFFIFVTTVYPVTIITSLILYRKKQDIKFAYYPYKHLLLILLVYLLWI